MTAPLTMNPFSMKPGLRLAWLLGASLCLPACDRAQPESRSASGTAPSAAATTGSLPADSAAAGPASLGQPGTARPVLQSILAPPSAPVASRAGGLAGATAIIPARTDEPCLGLTGGALDECLLAELGTPETGESPDMREFREAQRQRDQELLREEAEAIAADGQQGTPEPVDADEAYARERDAQWERERARLEREEDLQRQDPRGEYPQEEYPQEEYLPEEYLQEDVPEDFPPEDFER